MHLCKAKKLHLKCRIKAYNYRSLLFNIDPYCTGCCTDAKAIFQIVLDGWCVYLAQTCLLYVSLNNTKKKTKKTAMAKPWPFDFQNSWKPWKKLQEFPLNRLLSIQGHTHMHTHTHTHHSSTCSNLKTTTWNWTWNLFTTRQLCQPQHHRGRKKNSKKNEWWQKRRAGRGERNNKTQQSCVHPPNTTVKLPNKTKALLSSDLLPDFDHFFPLFHSVCQF